jgi:hypothetical protein
MARMPIIEDSFAKGRAGFSENVPEVFGDGRDRAATTSCQKIVATGRLQLQEGK